MNTRCAIPSDAPILAQYNRDACVEAKNPPLNLQKSEAGVRAVLRDENRGIYLVGEEKGKIISMILLTKEWSDWNNAHWYVVSSVYTHPDFRKQGRFSALLKGAKQKAIDDPECCGLKLEVRHDNAGAKKAYEKLGFVWALREAWRMPL